MIGFVAGDAVQDGTDHAKQSHVQKCSGISANGKCIGGGQRGILNDSQKTGDHLRPVRHEKGSSEKEAAERIEK